MREKTAMTFISGIWASAMLEMTSSVAFSTIQGDAHVAGAFPLVTGVATGGILVSYCILRAKRGKVLSEARPGG